MLDTYQREGMFPTSLPNGGHFFNGPIRSHYRPRRLWSLLILMLTTYITLPPVFFALYALFCSGLVNVLIAFALILSGINFFPFLLLWINAIILFSFSFNSGVRVVQTSRIDPRQQGVCIWPFSQCR